MKQQGNLRYVGEYRVHLVCKVSDISLYFPQWATKVKHVMDKKCNRL